MKLVKKCAKPGGIGNMWKPIQNGFTLKTILPVLMSYYMFKYIAKPLTDNTIISLNIKSNNM